MIKHISLRITGKVQGVFFRASTKEEADKYFIKGLVRNERDGSVYIEAEGEEDVLKTFTEWCRRGPRTAIVDHCEVAEDNVKGFDEFIISR